MTAYIYTSKIPRVKQRPSTPSDKPIIVVKDK